MNWKSLVLFLGMPVSKWQPYQTTTVYDSRLYWVATWLAEKHSSHWAVPSHSALVCSLLFHRNRPLVVKNPKVFATHGFLCMMSTSRTDGRSMLRMTPPDGFLFCSWRVDGALYISSDHLDLGMSIFPLLAPTGIATKSPMTVHFSCGGNWRSPDPEQTSLVGTMWVSWCVLWLYNLTIQQKAIE